MPNMQEIKERFSHDRFATEAAEIMIREAKPQFAVCEMPLLQKHRNARGTPMGGAIFTLADFTAAVAANGFAEHADTISLHADISFLGTAKGKTLIAKASCVKQGRTTSLYTVEVTDELGTLVAQASVNGFVLQK